MSSRSDQQVVKIAGWGQIVIPVLWVLISASLTNEGGWYFLYFPILVLPSVISGILLLLKSSIGWLLSMLIAGLAIAVFVRPLLMGFPETIGIIIWFVILFTLLSIKREIWWSKS